MPSVAPSTKPGATTTVNRSPTKKLTSTTAAAAAAGASVAPISTTPSKSSTSKIVSSGSSSALPVAGTSTGQHSAAASTTASPSSSGASSPVKQRGSPDRNKPGNSGSTSPGKSVPVLNSSPNGKPVADSGPVPVTVTADVESSAPGSIAGAATISHSLLLDLQKLFPEADLDALHGAATRIQSTYRGYVVRKNLSAEGVGKPRRFASAPDLVSDLNEGAHHDDHMNSKPLSPPPQTQDSASAMKSSEQNPPELSRKTTSPTKEALQVVRVSSRLNVAHKKRDAAATVIQDAYRGSVNREIVRDVVQVVHNASKQISAVTGRGSNGSPGSRGSRSSSASSNATGSGPRSPRQKIEPKVEDFTQKKYNKVQEYKAIKIQRWFRARHNQSEQVQVGRTSPSPSTSPVPRKSANKISREPSDSSVLQRDSSAADRLRARESLSTLDTSGSSKGIFTYQRSWDETLSSSPETKRLFRFSVDMDPSLMSPFSVSNLCAAVPSPHSSPIRPTLFSSPPLPQSPLSATASGLRNTSNSMGMTSSSGTSDLSATSPLSATPFTLLSDAFDFRESGPTSENVQRSVASTCVDLMLHDVLRRIHTGMISVLVHTSSLSRDAATQKREERALRLSEEAKRVRRAAYSQVTRYLSSTASSVQRSPQLAPHPPPVAAGGGVRSMRSISASHVQESSNRPSDSVAKQQQLLQKRQVHERMHRLDGTDPNDPVNSGDISTGNDNDGTNADSYEDDRDDDAQRHGMSASITSSHAGSLFGIPPSIEAYLALEERKVREMQRELQDLRMRERERRNALARDIDERRQRQEQMDTEALRRMDAEEQRRHAAMLENLQKRQEERERRRKEREAAAEAARKETAVVLSRVSESAVVNTTLGGSVKSRSLGAGVSQVPGASTATANSSQLPGPSGSSPSTDGTTSGITGSSGGPRAPLHIVMERAYVEKVVQPELERRKKILAERHRQYESPSKEELQDFAQRIENELRTRRERTEREHERTKGEWQQRRKYGKRQLGPLNPHGVDAAGEGGGDGGGDANNIGSQAEAGAASGSALVEDVAAALVRRVVDEDRRRKEILGRAEEDVRMRAVRKQRYGQLVREMFAPTVDQEKRGAVQAAEREYLERMDEIQRRRHAGDEVMREMRKFVGAVERPAGQTQKSPQALPRPSSSEEYAHKLRDIGRNYLEEVKRMPKKKVEEPVQEVVQVERIEHLRRKIKAAEREAARAEGDSRDELLLDVVKLKMELLEEVNRVHGH